VSRVGGRAWSPFLFTLGLLAVVFAAVASSYSRRYALPARTAAGIYLCFMLLLGAALAPGFGGIRAQLTAIRKTPVLAALGCLPYLIYAAGTRDFRWTALAKLLAIAIGVPAVYGKFRVKDESRFNWQDACVAVMLIGVVLSGQLRGIWNVPVNLDFMGRLFLVGVASWCWVFVRRVPQLGYEFRFSSAVLKEGALNFGYFAAIAIPASLAMHFTKWNPRWHGAGEFCLDYLEIFLFVALLEELFFRGFLQTLLSNTFGSWLAGQTVVSVVFGLFHVLHRPFPNWRYVVLASVAGWFYGSAFRKSQNLMASTWMHAAVDTVWRTWLTTQFS
jgi:membrane protease YdiL (CAAX protease family)